MAELINVRIWESATEPEDTTLWWARPNSDEAGDITLVWYINDRWQPIVDSMSAMITGIALNDELLPIVDGLVNIHAASESQMIEVIKTLQKLQETSIANLTSRNGTVSIVKEGNSRDLSFNVSGLTSDKSAIQEDTDGRLDLFWSSTN